MSPPPQRDAGQASLEYVGVVALVVLVLAAAALATGRAGDLAHAMAGQVHRALCVVGGGDCERDREPCVVSSRQEHSRLGARIAIVRLGSGWTGVVERRSDGRWVVSRVREDGGGLDLSSGLRGEVALGTLGGLGAGGEARAAALAHAGGGLSWTVGTRAQADALLRTLRRDQVATLSGPSLGRLVADRLVDLPAPDEVYGERGWRLTLDARADAALGEEGLGSGSVSLSAAQAAGTRRRGDGHRVLYLRRTSALEAALDIPGLGAAGGGRRRDATVGIEVDGRGRPVALSLLETGELRGSGDLPAAVQVAAGLLTAAGEGTRRFEVERHLDLTVPANLVAAREVLAAVGDPMRLRDATAPGAALRRRIAEDAVVHARVYAVEARSHGVDLAAALGVGAGVEATHEVVTARLLAAATRGIGGRWARRADCLDVA